MVCLTVLLQHGYVFLGIVFHVVFVFILFCFFFSCVLLPLLFSLASLFVPLFLFGSFGCLCVC